jgi:hypothetical protein
MEKGKNTTLWKPAIKRELWLPTNYVAKTLGVKIYDVSNAAMALGLQKIMIDYAEQLKFVLGKELYQALLSKLEKEVEKE